MRREHMGWHRGRGCAAAGFGRSGGCHPGMLPQQDRTRVVNDGLEDASVEGVIDWSTDQVRRADPRPKC